MPLHSELVLIGWSLIIEWHLPTHMLIASRSLLMRHKVVLHILMLISTAREWILIGLHALHGRHSTLLWHWIIVTFWLEVILVFGNILNRFVLITSVVLVAVVLLLEVAHLLPLHVVIMLAWKMLLIPLCLRIERLIWVLHWHHVSLSELTSSDHVLTWHLIHGLGHGTAHHLLFRLIVLVHERL